jgi:hypothetical protein
MQTGFGLSTMNSRAPPRRAGCGQQVFQLQNATDVPHAVNRPCDPDPVVPMASLFVTTVGFALASAAAMLLSGGSWLPVCLAYMVGGWMGLGLALASVVMRNPRD